MEHKSQVWLKISTVIFLLLFLLFFGSLMYRALEGWDTIDALYFTAMTLITIGYGDLVPTHAMSKLFTVGFSIIGVGLFLFFLAVLAESYFYKNVQHFEKKVETIKQHMKKTVEEKVENEVAEKVIAVKKKIKKRK